MKAVDPSRIVAFAAGFIIVAGTLMSAFAR